MSCSTASFSSGSVIHQGLPTTNYPNLVLQYEGHPSISVAASDLMILNPRLHSRIYSKRAEGRIYGRKLWLLLDSGYYVTRLTFSFFDDEQIGNIERPLNDNWTLIVSESCILVKESLRMLDPRSLYYIHKDTVNTASRNQNQRTVAES